jgi:hypothetical protein
MPHLQNFLCSDKRRAPNSEYDPYRQLYLHELVNATDFIEFNELLRLFEVDSYPMCMQALIKEKELNYNYDNRQVEIHDLVDSFKAKHI